jgi:hypothetical protein
MFCPDVPTNCNVKRGMEVSIPSSEKVGMKSKRFLFRNFSLLAGRTRTLYVAAVVVVVADAVVQHNCRSKCSTAMEKDGELRIIMNE